MEIYFKYLITDREASNSGQIDSPKYLKCSDLALVSLPNRNLEFVLLELDMRPHLSRIVY